MSYELYALDSDGNKLQQVGTADDEEDAVKALSMYKQQRKHLPNSHEIESFRAFEA